MTSTTLDSDLKAAIRSIPDYPKPGIIFRDITTLLGDARAFRAAVDRLVQPWAGGKIDKVAGIEARGFILGGAVAHQVSAGFIPIRKKGKLPFKRVSVGYSLEYGLDEMEMHEDALTAGERVVLVDDLDRHGRHRRSGDQAAAPDGRRRARGLLRHRPAGARRRGEAAHARGAGEDAGVFRGPLRSAGPFRSGGPARHHRTFDAASGDQPDLRAGGLSAAWRAPMPLRECSFRARKPLLCYIVRSIGQALPRYSDGAPILGLICR